MIEIRGDLGLGLGLGWVRGRGRGSKTPSDFRLVGYKTIQRRKYVMLLISR